MTQDVGTGTTLGFGTSSFSADVLSVSMNDQSRESIETTHMGTTNFRTFMPSDLVDGGTLEFEIAFDPTAQPPIAGAAETVTMTFPDASTFIFTGFVTSWNFTDPLEDRMTATVTVKIDGNTEPAWA